MLAGHVQVGDTSFVLLVIVGRHSANQMRPSVRHENMVGEMGVCVDPRWGE